MNKKKLISYLSNKQFYSLPSIGKGELLFSLIFSNAHRPRGKKSNESGDVIVNNKNLEVKGKGARLGGQSGYGKGFSASKFIKTKFIKINNNEAVSNKIEDLDNISFNFDNERITSATNSFLMLCNITAKNNESFDLDNAKEIMIGAFKQIFVNENAFNEAIGVSNFTDYLIATESTNNDEHSFENHSSYKKLMNNKTSLNNELKTLNAKYKIDKSNMELKNSIKDLKIKIKDVETKIDELKTKFLSTTKFKIDNSNDQFSNSLLMFSLKYYQLVDGFSYFALTNENEFVVLNIDQLDNKEAVTNSIKVLAGISFADNAGEQGGKISIKLK